MGMAPELCLGHLKIIPHKVGTPIVIMEPIFVGEGCAHLFGGFSFPDHGCEVLVAPLREKLPLARSDSTYAQRPLLCCWSPYKPVQVLDHVASLCRRRFHRLCILWTARHWRRVAASDPACARWGRVVSPLNVRAATSWRSSSVAPLTRLRGNRSEAGERKGRPPRNGARNGAFGQGMEAP
jgi:hypothetical protein